MLLHIIRIFHLLVNQPYVLDIAAVRRRHWSNLQSGAHQLALKRQTSNICCSSHRAAPLPYSTSNIELLATEIHGKA